MKIKRRTAEELGVDDFTYSFFRGESEDIKNFKALNLSLETGYSFLEIGKAVKAYDENRDLKDKINIYKALRDFINNKNYLKIHEKIYFAEEIVKATSDRNIYREIVSYFVELLGDTNGLEKRLTMKGMLRFPINMKVFFINLFLEI